jgi:hypothetical protein
MTNALVRLGLPNSMVILVLAVMPVVAAATAPARHADMSRLGSAAGTLVAGIGMPADAAPQTSE